MGYLKNATIFKCLTKDETIQNGGLEFGEILSPGCLPPGFTRSRASPRLQDPLAVSFPSCNKGASNPGLEKQLERTDKESVKS